MWFGLGPNPAAMLPPPPPEAFVLGFRVNPVARLREAHALLEEVVRHINARLCNAGR